MTREGWLKLAERIEIPTDFAKALWEEMEEQDWIASDGVRVVSAAKFLRAAWLRESSKTSTQAGGDRREAWQIERDIERIKKEIKRITSDKASYNHNKQGPSLAEHKLKFEDEWLAYLSRMERGGKAKLGADYAEFLREHEEHVRQLIADGVPASTMGDEYRLARFADRFKDEADLTFEDWDRTMNKANRWLNPDELKPDIKVQIREMKAVISRLESEKMAAIAG